MLVLEDLLNNWKQNAVEKAEYLEEEINILIHKLKFLPQESLPTVLILDQRNGFDPLGDTVLEEKVKIAGGVLTTDLTSNPHIILIKQEDESLYSTLPLLLHQKEIQDTNAYKHNSIFIIQNHTFHTMQEQYLEDVEILAETLQPKYFFYGRDGQDWVKFDVA